MTTVDGRADLFAHASWTLHRILPDATADDAACSGIPARVPGTVSGALRDAFGPEAVAGLMLPEATWEFRTSVTSAGGWYRVCSDGIATVAELEITPARAETATRAVASSHSAFAPWQVGVWLESGRSDVVLRLRPLRSMPTPRTPRARWLSPLVRDRSMRWRRSPLIGAIDWPGALEVIGPWGGLRAEPAAAVEGFDGACVVPRPLAVTSRWQPGADGIVTVTWRATRGTQPVTVRVECAPVHGTDRASTSGAASDSSVAVEQRVRPEDTRESPDGTVTVQLRVPNPQLWWPHGMGAAALYAVRVSVRPDAAPQRSVESEHRVGFRSVHAEPRAGAERGDGPRGLALQINGVPVFVRGVVWTGADDHEVVANPERIRAVLWRLREAGVTMIRIPGTGCYETSAFHRACDELGLMVWQDVALGPLDPPDDAAWSELLAAEVEALSARLAAHPSTVVVSGGTEVIQAPVLAGRPVTDWSPRALFDTIPRAVARGGADVIVVPTTPCTDAQLDAAARVYAAELAALAAGRPADGDPGSVLEADAESGTSHAPSCAPTHAPWCAPTDADEGTSHYFGVGAYGRELTDARTAGVCFAAECLAFAVAPEPHAVRRDFGADGPLDGPPAAAEAWRTGIARDPGASWTFQDVTERYARRLFTDPDSDPEASLARAPRSGAELTALEHAQRLEYDRASLAHVFQRTLTEWRREGSSCRGALVLAARSTAPGAGWGVLDHTGAPTAAYYGMRRACAPTAVSFLPEGGNGLSVSAWHDGPEPWRGTLRLSVATVHGGRQPPIDQRLVIPARGEYRVRADLADGSFRDLDHAYGFGEREYEAVLAELLDEHGAVCARDVHVCGGVRRDGLESNAGQEQRATETSRPAGELGAVPEPSGDPGLSATWCTATDGAHAVRVRSERLARFVALDLPEGWVARDGYVHVLPGDEVVLAVDPHPGSNGASGPGAAGDSAPTPAIECAPGPSAAFVRALGVPPVPVH